MEVAAARIGKALVRAALSCLPRRCLPHAWPLQASPPKFEKALQLLVKLINSSLGDGNGMVFALALEALAEHLPRRPSPAVREAISVMFDTLDERRDAFSTAETEYLDGLTLRARARCDLLGDDTFAFRAACRRVQRALDALPKPVHAGSPDVDSDGDRACRGTGLQGSILDCLRTALDGYAHQWKRADVDQLFRSASLLRMRFAPEPRGRLDDMATELREKQTKPQGRGASAWTAQDAREQTHPLRRRPAIAGV